MSVARDSVAAMGYATTRPAERVAASVGLLASAPIRFAAACDVPSGGVLLALPALLAAGLRRHTTELYHNSKPDTGGNDARQPDGMQRGNDVSGNVQRHGGW